MQFLGGFHSLLWHGHPVAGKGSRPSYNYYNLYTPEQLYLQSHNLFLNDLDRYLSIVNGSSCSSMSMTTICRSRGDDLAYVTSMCRLSDL